MRRDAHPGDGRARSLAVTEAGAELANRAVVAVEECDAAFFGPLGAGQAAFTRQLRELVSPPSGSR